MEGSGHKDASSLPYHGLGWHCRCGARVAECSALTACKAHPITFAAFFQFPVGFACIAHAGAVSDWIAPAGALLRSMPVCAAHIFLVSAQGPPGLAFVAGAAGAGVHPGPAICGGLAAVRSGGALHREAFNEERLGGWQWLGAASKQTPENTTQHGSRALSLCTYSAPAAATAALKERALSCRCRNNPCQNMQPTTVQVLVVLSSL